ncbi:siderophore ABC transporter substrate-binding protein [Falsirhodobacter deserti]|uniref:siderophore ABC transporter substrate-binding protein n=1 Tax=Falsirhodobacter deserti TaxID=1365611 RepID=UPI001F4ECC8D|nr:siderophore ABC transporter substrate-binding protein [Falsirhodobacter deserti]
MTIKHQQGEVTLPATPEKVLVLDWATVDTLDAMGVSVAGVPGANAPSYLAKYESDDYLKIGSLFEPDVEAVAAADADLMIVAARSREAQPQLNGILPTIDLSIDNGNFIDSVEANIAELGRIFDKEDRAAEMTAELDAKVERLREAAQGQGRALTLVVSGSKIGVYGPDSRTGWLHNEIGFPSVMDDVDDRSDRGDAASYEFILDKNPDWMFVVDRDAAVGNEGASPAKAVLDNELVRQTNAWKNGQVVYLNPEEAYVVMNGYQALTGLLDQVYEAVTADN